MVQHKAFFRVCEESFVVEASSVLKDDLYGVFCFSVYSRERYTGNSVREGDDMQSKLTGLITSLTNPGY